MTSATSFDGPHLGTWMLRSYTREDLQTGAKTDLFGPHPSGYLIYTPEGRMSALFVRDGRTAPSTMIPTEAERIDLYGGMIAYGGWYTIEGDIVRHHIDTSWNQIWSGTSNQRQFKIEGDVLTIRTAPSPNPVDGEMSSSILIWQRAKRMPA
jgi:Lipocalin-like domain